MSEPAVHSCASPRGSDLLDIEQIYRRNVGYVFRLLRRFGVSDDEVEDATQEVFMTVHRRIADFDASRGTMRTWLFAIARGAAANRRRSCARRLQVVPPGETSRAVDARPDPEACARTQQTLAHVARFVATLPPNQREVFELIEVEGLRGPEASAALGVKLNTVYTRLRGARIAFKQFVATLGLEQEREGGSA